MADSVQMMDLVSLSKNLTRVRGTDQEQLAAANRLGAAAAAHRIEERHQDVERGEEARESKRHERGDARRGGKGHDGHQHPRDEKPPEPVPEQTEGHLLNLKV